MFSFWFICHDYLIINNINKILYFISGKICAHTYTHNDCKLNSSHFSDEKNVRDAFNFNACF